MRGHVVGGRAARRGVVDAQGVGARAEDVPADAEVPAQEDAEPSIWTYIESADGALPTPSTVQATAELVEERTAELVYTGIVGAAPPLAYYLDPVGATDLDPLHLDKVDPKEFDIPIVVNDEVVGEIAEHDVDNELRTFDEFIVLERVGHDASSFV